MKFVLKNCSSRAIFCVCNYYFSRDDIRLEPSSNVMGIKAGGVRMLWGSTISGKSTTLVKFLNNLYKEGGVFILFNQFGKIIKPHEKLSSLLPRFKAIHM